MLVKLKNDMSLARHVSERGRSFSSGLAQSAFFRFVTVLIVSLVSLFATKSELFAQEYFWSDGITVSGGGTVATSSVAGQGYTISSTLPFGTAAGLHSVQTFPDQYKIPGDAGIPAVTVFNESAGGTYTLTFDQPVERPMIAVASLGQVGQPPVSFDFGQSVDILWTGSYEAAGYVTPSSGTTASVSAVEGYVVARYTGTVSTVTFSPSPESNGSMMLIVGFEVSTTPPEITAPGGSSGDASAVILPMVKGMRK